MTIVSYPKDGGQSCKQQTGGSKQVKEQFLTSGQPSDLGTAPPSRVFTRSYEKVADADDKTYGDTVTPYVGNPLRW